MPHPNEDDLAGLAAGEDTALEVAAHVETCEQCSVAMAELRNTIAHLRTVPDIDDGWVVPPAGLWSRIADDLDAPSAASAGPAAVPPAADPATPTVTEVASPTVATDLARYRADRLPAPRRRTWLVAGLAAASLVVGLTAGRFIWGPSESGTSTIVVTAPLDTLDTKVREGSAALERVDGRLDLRVATASALDAGDGYLEVWLINRDLKRMVSVGVLRSGETGLFPVSQALLDQGYVIVDVSREAFDDKPQHSGVSLLRGQLPA